MQCFKRGNKIATIGEILPVFAGTAACPQITRDGLGRIDKFTRTRNEIDTADMGTDTGDRPDHFKAELRNAIAIRAEGEIFKNHIGCPPIGGRIFNPFFRNNQRVGILNFVPFVKADCQQVAIQHLPVCPDTAQKPNRSLAQGNGEIAVITIAICGCDGGGCRRIHTADPALSAHAALTAPRCCFGDGLVELLAEARGPDERATKTRTPVKTRDRRAFG